MQGFSTQSNVSPSFVRNLELVYHTDPEAFRLFEQIVELLGSLTPGSKAHRVAMDFCKAQESITLQTLQIIVKELQGIA